MSVPISKLDKFKLETTFGDGFVVNATYDWTLSTVNRRLSTWKQEKLLGKGGFGEVWQQKEEGTGKLRAVKELRKDTTMIMGFTQELLALIGLGDHKHLFIEFFGWYETESKIFFAMEYIEHGDLSEYIKADEAMAKGNAKEITKQILEGLQVLHSQGICHRDLKPHNVLVASRDPLWVKIADFGTSKRVTGTALRTRCGTQGYVAPELLKILPRKFKIGELEEFTYALDMWSLGCLVHELLTSQTPFHELPEEYDDAPEIESGFTTTRSEVDMSRLCDYCQGRMEFPVETLRSVQVTEQGIDFVKSLLVADPDERATATHALRHPWLANTDYVSEWYSAVESECSSMCLALNSPMNKTFLRQLRATDIAEYIIRPGTTTLTSILGKALTNGCYSIAAMVLSSPTRHAEENSATEFEALFEEAVMEAQADWVKVLLSGGRDVNRALVSGKAALQIAVMDGDLEMVEVLLTYHANSNAQPTDGDGPRVLQMAIESGFNEIVKLLLASKADIHFWVGPGSILMTAIDRRDTQLVDLLLSNGADVNAAVNGQTPLQIAVKRGDFTLVKLLLRHNCEVDSKPDGETGITALQAAACRGHLEMVTVLLANGAQVNAEPALNDSLTALQGAAEQGHLSVVELLIEHKADVNARPSFNGWTALQAAVKGGHTAIVDLLLENNANVNAEPSHSGRTAIQAAAEQGHIHISEILLAAGADVNAPPSKVNGCIALQTAVKDGNVAMVKLLLLHHANAKAKPTRGSTLFNIATEEKHTEIVKLLSNHMAEASARSIEMIGLYADIVLSVLLMSEKTRFVNTGQSPVKIPSTPPLRSIPYRLLLSFLNDRRIRDIPWTVYLLHGIFEPLDKLLDPKARRHPTNFTNWAMITQTTLIRTAVALLLTEGATVKPTPSKYSAWPLFFLESFLLFWPQSLLNKGPGQSSRWFFAKPIGSMVLRLLFINRNAVSLNDTALMASLAEPLAEFVISLVFPHWDVDRFSSFNFARERGLHHIIHLFYFYYRTVMATRRARRATGVIAGDV